MLCISFNNPSLCFSEQDLLDILLVRHSVDYYHCDCRPYIQTTATFQLQIAKWVTFPILSHPKNENIKVMFNHLQKFNYLFYVFFSFTYLPQACQINAHSSKINQRESPISWKTWYSSHEFVFTNSPLMLEYFLGARCIHISPPF